MEPPAAIAADVCVPDDAKYLAVFKSATSVHEPFRSIFCICCRSGGPNPPKTKPACSVPLPPRNIVLQYLNHQL